MHISQVILLLALSSLAFDFGGCTKFDLLNATVPAWGYTRTRNIAYGNVPRQTLDVYRPAGASQNAGVVVFFYGGDWQEGTKEDYRFVAQAICSQGFVAVMPDYRLYPDVTFPAFVNDGAQAVRWTHDHAAEFGGDPRKIFLMGHSAGAYIAAMLTLNGEYLAAVGLDRSNVRAAATLSGPYDDVPISRDRPVFGLGPTDSVAGDNAQPIHFVDGKAPPMLLVHGMRDTLIDPSTATRLAAAIQKAGGKVTVKTYPNRAHADIVLSLASAFRWLAPVLRDSGDFFRAQAASQVHAPRVDPPLDDQQRQRPARDDPPP